MTTNNNSNVRTKVVCLVKEIRQMKGLEPAELPDTARLDRTGWGLDSLDLAQLSAALEQEFGHDPYSQRVFALTVGEIVDYYQTYERLTE